LYCPLTFFGKSRDSSCNPGSTISLSANIQPVFEQLSLYDELLATCIPASTFEIVNAQPELIALFGAEDVESTALSLSITDSMQVYMRRTRPTGSHSVLCPLREIAW